MAGAGSGSNTFSIFNSLANDINSANKISGPLLSGSEIAFFISGCLAATGAMAVVKGFSGSGSTAAVGTTASFSSDGILSPFRSSLSSIGAGITVTAGGGEGGVDVGDAILKKAEATRTITFEMKDSHMVI